MIETIFTENNTKIKNSYLIANKNIETELIKILQNRKNAGFKVTRTLDSYAKEWKAHNNLYKLHLYRSHTQDVDLEENISKKNQCIWKILGI